MGNGCGGGDGGGGDAGATSGLPEADGTQPIESLPQAGSSAFCGGGGGGTHPVETFVQAISGFGGGGGGMQPVESLPQAISTGFDGTTDGASGFGAEG